MSDLEIEIKYNENNILRDGYGIIPRIIVRDNSLTIEAKAIYSYLVAFAGTKRYCYPSRDLMCRELGISVNRFTKHLKILKESGYIKINRAKSKNLQSKNIYEIVMDERDRVNSRCINFEYLENEYLENEYLENEYTNINSTNINSTNINKKKEKRKKETDLDILINQYTNNNSLKEALIDFIKMRKSIKKPLTGRALKGILNKLDAKAANNDEMKIALLDQSIEHCWQTIYDLKENKQYKSYQSVSKLEETFKSDEETERLEAERLEREYIEKYGCSPL